jgi:hypothetical protein
MALSLCLATDSIGGHVLKFNPGMTRERMEWLLLFVKVIKFVGETVRIARRSEATVRRGASTKSL